MAILDRLRSRKRPTTEMDEATFSFDTVEHPSAARFLELEADEDAPTMEMSAPPVMNVEPELPAGAPETEVFLRFAAEEHRRAHVAPRPNRMAEGSGPIDLHTLDEGITIDFDSDD